MKLYLVQHCDALSKDENPERPLSEKGLKDAIKMAAFLHNANVLVDEVAHSGKLRAEETAAVLCKTVWLGQAAVKMDGLKPGDPINHLMNTALTSGGDLMVVGHMPFMGKMAAACLDGAIINYEPGAVLCLGRADDGWSLNWFIKPMMLRDL
ncbi:phosphohistidine phosphatase SixA [Pseudomonadota bacterium]